MGYFRAKLAQEQLIKNNGIVEIAGPERMRISDAVERYLRAISDPRKVVPDAKAGFFGIDVNDRSLTPDSNASLGAIHLDAWLRQQPKIA